MSDVRGDDAGAIIAPRDPLDLEQLRPWLTAHAPTIMPAGASLAVRQFASGFSNLTYQLLVDTGGEARRYVLRRPPRGVTGGVAHDMAREHDILAALHPLGVPVPRPLARCDDAGVIGAPFYVMEHVDGLILRGSPDRMPTLDALDAGTMRALSAGFVRTLAGLHAVDVSKGPLHALAREGSYVQRQVQGWTRRWHSSRTEHVDAMEEVARWLAAHRPPDAAQTLVHNDFKYDNIVLDRADPSRVVAILDWEMATVGDPLLDLGTSLAYWVEASDAPVFRSLGLGMTALPGNLTRAELVRAYGVETGRDVSNAAYYYAFGLFKVAVIAQQIFARHVQGLTADPRFARLDVVVSALADPAQVAAQTGRV